ncbi:MAG: hypothetical protein ABIR91_01990 [Candidatus Saccharimonadales bacterium]
MTDETIKTAADYILPSSIVTKRDVSELANELERIDNDTTANAVRQKAGVSSQNEPQFSAKLTDFTQLNELDLSKPSARSGLIVQLRQLKNIIPVIHMTFSTDVDLESLTQLTQWTRTSIHPQAVIEVGLQPSLIAGVYVRTPNKVHDLSMRSALQSGRKVLVQELEALDAGR